MDEQILPYDILRFDYKERLQDRFLATHLHRFEVFSKPVALIVLVEIINPWHPSSELGQKILNSLIREFLRSDAQSYLSRFENALKETNRAVRETLDQTKSPVSCVAVLLEPDQIHSSGIGTAKLGLLRRGKLATILGSKEPENETFVAVTSGDMKDGDWLLVANDTFYATLAKLESQLWLDEDIPAIGAKISQVNHPDGDQRSAGVLLRYNLISPPVNQTFLWDGSSPLSSGDNRFAHVLGENNRFAHVLAKGKQPAWWPKVNFSALMPLTVMLGGLMSQVWHFLVRLFAPARNRSTEDDHRHKQPPLESAKRYLPVFVFILAIAIVFWLGYRQTHKDQPTQVSTPTLLTELQNLPTDQRPNHLEDKFSQNDYRSLSASNREELTTLLKNQKISLVDLPPAIIQVPEEIVALAILNSQPLLLDSQGRIWIFNGSQLTPMTQKRLIANPVSMAAFSQTNIIATDSSGNLWRFDGTDDQPRPLTQTGELAKGIKLVDHYQGNLYLVNQLSKTVYRVSNFADSLAGISIYNKPDNLSSLTTPIDIAINGKVVVADTNGLVVEFARNAIPKTRLQLPLADKMIKIAASDSFELTIVGSGRTLYLIDSVNTLVGTMFLAIDAKIGDIVLDPSSPTKVWIAVGKELYIFNLPKE